MAHNCLLGGRWSPFIFFKTPRTTARPGNIQVAYLRQCLQEVRNLQGETIILDVDGGPMAVDAGDAGDACDEAARGNAMAMTTATDAATAGVQRTGPPGIAGGADHAGTPGTPITPGA